MDAAFAKQNRAAQGGCESQIKYPTKFDHNKKIINNYYFWTRKTIIYQTANFV